MSTNEKTADVAATTTTAPNNEQAVQTPDTTPAPEHQAKTPRPRIFHITARETENGIHCYCGHFIAPGHIIRVASPVADQRPKTECAACRYSYDLDHQLDAERHDRILRRRILAELLDQANKEEDL